MDIGLLIVSDGIVKNDGRAGCPWLTPVILATQKAEIRRITGSSNSLRDLILRMPNTHTHTHTHTHTQRLSILRKVNLGDIRYLAKKARFKAGLHHHLVMWP
jgi:hypothetical protein